MMLCPNCGAQMPDDSVFCEKCGTPLAAQQQSAPPMQPQQQQYQPQQQYQQPQYQQPKGVPTKTKATIAILCAAAIVLWLFLRLLGLL